MPAPPPSTLAEPESERQDTTMFSITLKLMKKSARMLIPAGIAILIGTAFIAATFLFGNAMNDALAAQNTAQLGGANYVISPDSGKDLTDKDQDYIYTRTVNDFQLDRIRATEGVKDARASYAGSVTVTRGNKHASSYVITTAAKRTLLPVTITQGDQPADSNEIALTKSVADQLGVKVGDRVTVNSQAAQYAGKTGDSAGNTGDAGDESAQNADGTSSHDGDSDAASGASVSSDGANTADSGMTVRVVGLTDDPNGAYAYYGGASVLSDNVITAMAGSNDFGNLPVYLVYLDIDDASDTAAASTVKQVSTLLPKHFSVQSRAALVEESVKSMSSGETSITTIFLLSFGILAMLVAALVIANTFQVLVAQRRRTLALLRTICANKSQLYVSVLFEAGVLGLIASALGVGLGIGLMAALCQSGLMKATGMTKLNEDIVIPRSRLVELVEFCEAMNRETGLDIACFGHSGDGNIHTNIMVDDYTDPEKKALADACVDRLFRWVLEHGGTITGEHGIGLAKAKWFREAVGEGAFHLHELVKSALDPRNLLNPGKMGLP